MVTLNPDDMTPVVNRLRRAQGQLGGVIRLIEEGRVVLNTQIDVGPQFKSFAHDIADVFPESVEPADTRVNSAIARTLTPGAAERSG